MGYARKLPSGKFVPVYRDPLTRDKKQVPGETFPTKELASARADQYVVMLRRRYDGLGVETSVPRDVPTLAAYGPDALDRITYLSRTTLRKYNEQIRMMVREHFGETRIDRLTPDVVEEYYRTLVKRGASETMRGTRITALKHVIRRALRDGLIDVPHPDVWDVTIRTTAKSRRPVISSAEIDRLVKHMPSHLVATVWLAHDCGMRVGEIAGLQTARLDLEGQRITVADVVEPDGTERTYTKNREHRTLRLSNRACEALREHLMRHPSTGRVFQNVSKKRPASVAYLEYRLKRARKAAGIAWVRDGKETSVQWHDLRRAFATRLYKNGTSLVSIQRMMGHASVSQTEKYIQEYETEYEQLEQVRRAFDMPPAAADGSGS